jgi:hypothetical protein
MIRELVYKGFDPDQRFVEYAGLSTDTKPTEGLVTGSTFMEVDTGDVYLFDEVSETWKKVGS